MAPVYISIDVHVIKIQIPKNNIWWWHPLRESQTAQKQPETVYLDEFYTINFNVLTLVILQVPLVLYNKTFNFKIVSFRSTTRNTLHENRTAGYQVKNPSARIQTSTDQRRTFT